MEEAQKKFLLYFRLSLLVWILIANAFLHVIHFEYSWLIFISNIMMFTLEGDIKDRFKSCHGKTIRKPVLNNFDIYTDQVRDIFVGKAPCLHI